MYNKLLIGTIYLNIKWRQYNYANFCEFDGAENLVLYYIAGIMLRSKQANIIHPSIYFIITAMCSYVCEILWT